MFWTAPNNGNRPKIFTRESLQLQDCLDSNKKMQDEMELKMAVKFDKLGELKTQMGLT